MPTTTAFIDIHAHPAALPFYHALPAEPIPPAGSTNTITVGAIVPVGKMALVSLLESILKKVKPGGNILIVSHGNDAGLFLQIGRGKQGSSMLMADALDVILDNAGGNTSDADAAKMLFLDGKAFQNLKRLIAAVQKLGLDRVDVRSCNTGKNSGTLARLQQFFNCTTFCAPTIYDSFGVISINRMSSDPVVWTAWFKDKKHAGATLNGTPPDRLALWYKISMSPAKVTFDCLAESEKAAKQWATTHLGPSSFLKGHILYHALLDNIASKLIYMGDPGYRGLLAEVVKGNLPSRTVNPNDWSLTP